MTQPSKSPPERASSSALSSKPEATASSGTMRDANTKPLSERLKLPDNCRDVTSEQSGTKFALIVPPFRQKLDIAKARKPISVRKKSSNRTKARTKLAGERTTKRATAKKSKSKVRRTDTIKRDKATTNAARKKTAKRTTAKKAKSKVQRADTKGRDRSANIEEPFFFEVDEGGTVRSSNFTEPKINGDIFDMISINRLTTPENIIEEVEFPYAAVVDHFRRLAQVEREELMRRIELKDYRDDKELSQMRCIAEALEDEDNGWKEWIKIEGNSGSPRFKKVIVDWLAAPVEWQEDMPYNATAVGDAKHFFEKEDIAILNKLDVWIVEGENFLSTYYAAELHKKVDEANAIAQKLGLSYRFREAKK